MLQRAKPNISKNDIVFVELHHSPKNMA